MNDDQEESDDPGLRKPAWIKLTSKTYCACAHVVAPPTVMLSQSRLNSTHTEKLNNFRKKKKIYSSYIKGMSNITWTCLKNLCGSANAKRWILILKYTDILQLLLNFICKNICFCFNSCGAAFSLTKLHFQNIKKQFQLISNGGTKPEKATLKYRRFILTNLILLMI